MVVSGPERCRLTPSGRGRSHTEQGWERQAKQRTLYRTVAVVQLANHMQTRTLQRLINLRSYSSINADTVGHNLPHRSAPNSPVQLKCIAPFQDTMLAPGRCVSLLQVPYPSMLSS